MSIPVDSTRWQALPFALFALCLLVTATYSVVVGIKNPNGLRIGFGVLQYGMALAMIYEALALWFPGRRPTISHVTNQALLQYPVEWLVVFVVVMAAAGLLSAHFSVQRRSVTWLVIVIGIAAYITGAAITAITDWNP